MTHADDKRITLLLRGELSESEAAEVMEHIAKCDECADRMADLTLDMALRRSARGHERVYPRRRRKGEHPREAQTG